MKERKGLSKNDALADVLDGQGYDPYGKECGEVLENHVFRPKHLEVEPHDIFRCKSVYQIMVLSLDQTVFGESQFFRGRVMPTWQRQPATVLLPLIERGRILHLGWCDRRR